MYKTLVLIFALYHFSMAANVISERPRIWLTVDRLEKIRSKVFNGDADWVELKNWCDNHINDTGYDQGDANWQGYRGSGYAQYICNYALAYQCEKKNNNVNALQYADKALNIMDAVVSSFSVGDSAALGLAAIRVGESSDKTVNIDEANVSGIPESKYKGGYSARFFGPAMACGYDWLFDEIDNIRKENYSSVIFRWIDWYRGKRTSYNNGVVYNGIRYFEDNDGIDQVNENSNINGTGLGYAYNNVADNFFSGYAEMLALGSIAVYGHSEDDGLYFQVWEDLLTNIIIPEYTSETGLKGGNSPEGWNYASGIQRIVLAFEAHRTATDENPFDQCNLADDFFQAYVHATKPDLKSIYDHGEWTGSFKGVPYEPLFIMLPEILAVNSTNNDFYKIAQYYFNHVEFANSAQLWEKVLWKNSSFQEMALNNLPTYYRAIGTGLVTMRSKWETDAVWASVQLDTKLKTGHENYDEGHFTINNGGDYLITDGAYSTVFGHNSISFGGENQRTGYNDEVAIKLLDNKDDYLYVWADLTKAYQRVWKPSYADKFIRKFAYLKPNLFIILDICESSEGYESKQLMFNSINEPILGTNNIQIIEGSSKLFIETLLPISFNYNIGYHNTWMGEAWRTDITPTTINKNDIFLNVINITSANNSLIPSSKLILSENGEVLGAFIDALDQDNIIVMFSINSNEINNLTYTPPAKVRKHIIFDLKPNNYYNVGMEHTKFVITNTNIGDNVFLTNEYGTLIYLDKSDYPQKIQGLKIIK